MDIVHVPFEDARMSERRLEVMRHMLEAIRVMAAPLAECLEGHLRHLDEISARTGLSLLHHLLLSFSDDEQVELVRLAPDYLEMSEEALAVCVRLAAHREVFRGVEQPLIADTNNLLSPRAGQSEQRKAAGLEMNRCLGAICGFALDIEERAHRKRRGHLRLVHSS